MTAGVHLLVPIKPLHLAKTRLRGTAKNQIAHAALVAAVALDTVFAAREAAGVHEVVVVTSDPALTSSFAAEGIEVLADRPAAGLNAALRFGDEFLRQRCPGCRTGALQADLPALRPAELAAALRAAGAERTFCADRHGTGTTLLLAGAGQPLEPRFGAGSALAHRESGGKPLDDPWETLRCDVDTEADLRRATELGIGPRTTAQVTTATDTRTSVRHGSM